MPVLACRLGNQAMHDDHDKHFHAVEAGRKLLKELGELLAFKSFGY
jgi:hypothetical protein